MTLFNRRSLARGAAAGFMPGVAQTAAPEEGSTYINVRDLGAKGDGKTDDSKALQRAIDVAAERGGAVFVPPGSYATSELRMRRNVGLIGIPAWDYRRGGGSVLKLVDESARCLVNLTGAVGATIDGLSLEGGGLGKNINGVFLDKPDYGKEEDTFRIERCRVARFSGDGVNLLRVWCFSMRQNMIAFNRGDGVRCVGWDGFIIDNWFSGNQGSGFGGRGTASLTFTGNRIEWNREAGILLGHGSHCNITGNYIDRCGGCGIALVPAGNAQSKHVTITGNMIYRSGKWSAPDSQKSCHAWLEGAAGVTFSGNTMTAGRDDGQRGDWTPRYGLVYQGLQNCIIKDNVLHDGAIKELVLARGDAGEGVIVRNNPGRLFQPPAAKT